MTVMKMIWQSLRMLLWMTVLTGLFYPGLILLIAYFAFPDLSTGSQLMIDGKSRGSKLIAQKFTGDKYFWPRPSADDYNTLPSSASNLGPISKELKKQVDDRRQSLAKSNHGEESSVPIDLLFTSGSGLDPHISPEAAYFQIDRIAKARSKDPKRVKELVDALIEKPTLRVMGSPRVNVLMLNYELDQISKAEEKHG